MVCAGVLVGSGETIVIRNVTRHSADVYECIASNGVPPPAIRHIPVTVECKSTLIWPGLVKIHDLAAHFTQSAT